MHRAYTGSIDLGAASFCWRLTAKMLLHQLAESRTLRTHIALPGTRLAFSRNSALPGRARPVLLLRFCHGSAALLRRHLGRNRPRLAGFSFALFAGVCPARSKPHRVFPAATAETAVVERGGSYPVRYSGRDSIFRISEASLTRTTKPRRAPVSSADGVEG